MVRVKTDKKTNDLQTRHIVARYVETHVRCIETQREAKVGYRETKARHARKLRGIYFLVLDDEEFKDIMKNARRKLEVPMPAAIPCNIQRENCKKLVAL